MHRLRRAMIRYRSNRSGFTLIESIFAMIITMIAGLGTISAIIFTRQAMELDKQRLAALNYARQYMEQAISHNTVAPVANELLVPFNTPGVENLESRVEVEYFPIDGDGRVVWAEPQVAAQAARPMFCRVSVSWHPPGSFARMQMIRINAIIRAGTL
jgi:type II secretory pathway pseudopilin PulG